MFMLVAYKAPDRYFKGRALTDKKNLRNKIHCFGGLII